VSERLDLKKLTQGAVIIKPTTSRLQEVFCNYQTIKKLGSRTETIMKASVPMLELESNMYSKLRGTVGVPVMKVQF